MKANEVDSFWLLNNTVEAYKEEYNDLSDTWKQVDAKSQGTGTIAGIFVAAAFAWARELPKNILSWQRLLLSAGIALLIASIVFALLGLRIRRVNPPPVGENIKDMVKELLPNLKDKERAKRGKAFLNDQLALWSKSNQDMQSANNRKANWVQLSQIALLAAILCIAVVTLAVVINN